MRSVVLSFDVGTIYDKRFIELLDKYGLKATFNLNSGLGEYAWYLDSFPVERLTFCSLMNYHCFITKYR